MATSRGDFRNFRGGPVTTAATYGETVHGWLLRRFGRERYAAQSLADMAQSSRRAAENWLAGACAPNGQTLINLMAECEDLEIEIARLVKEARCAKK